MPTDFNPNARHPLDRFAYVAAWRWIESFQARTEHLPTTGQCPPTPLFKLSTYKEALADWKRWEAEKINAEED